MTVIFSSMMRAGAVANLVAGGTSAPAPELVVVAEVGTVAVGLTFSAAVTGLTFSAATGLSFSAATDWASWVETCEVTGAALR
jgi:hypothetical protein